MNNRNLKKVARSFQNAGCKKHRCRSDKGLISDFKRLLRDLGVNVSSIKTAGQCKAG